MCVAGIHVCIDPYNEVHIVAVLILLCLLCRSDDIIHTVVRNLRGTGITATVLKKKAIKFDDLARSIRPHSEGTVK